MNDYKHILVLLGILVLLCIVIDVLKKYLREGFVSKEAIELCDKSKKILGKDDRISFTDFRYKTGIKDIVQYDDIKKMYKKNDLTPANVQKTLSNN